MPAPRRSSLPWILSMIAHVAAVGGVVRAGDRPPAAAPVTVEIIRRRPPPPPPAMAGPEAAPAPPRPTIVRARARPRPAPAPLPVLPTVALSPAPSETAVALPVAPAPPPPAVSARPGAGLPALPRAGGGGTDLSGYLGFVNRAVAGKRRYPPMAIQLSLEGTVEIRVCVNRDGTLAGRPAVTRSSGHDLLDEEALQMVARAAPFPPLPAGYGGGTADFRVPVRFYLD